jgi:hypothetical protein
MPLAYESANSRLQFNYAVEGLSAREELLLKSIIRLLDHRTKHTWVYDPAKADLWIVDHESSVPSKAKYQNPLHMIRTLASLQTAEVISGASDSATGDADKSVMRLNAQNVEITLDQVGNWFGVKLNNLTEIDSNSDLQAESYKLLSWPTRLIQGDVTRSRISAMMLGKPLTMKDIVSKSGCDLGICEAYVQALKAEGFIDISKVIDSNVLEPLPAHKLLEQVTSIKQNKPLSIFARIRNRLVPAALGGNFK